MPPRKPTGVDVDHVIGAIDHALGDWTVSGDAMRWCPEPTADGLGFTVLDETHLWSTTDLRPFMEAIREVIRAMADPSEWRFYRGAS